MAENLIWLDAEMTGLNVHTDFILEIAAIATDADLNLIDQGINLEIYYDKSILDLMNEWNVTTHTKSGLIQRCFKSQHSIPSAEKDLLHYAESYVKPGLTPLCGNSIQQDRKFLQRFMPRLDRFFHYRNIDISTLKELSNRWYPTQPKFKKHNKHMALEDIIESVNELKYYREHMFKKP